MTRTKSGWLSSSWFKSGLILLTSCALVGFIVSQIPLTDVLNKNWVDVHIRNSGWQGMWIFFALGAATTAIGAPRQMIAFLGGYAFGFVDGCLLSTIAVTGGCIISFAFSRLLGRLYVRKRFARRIQRVDQFLASQPVSKTIIIRLLPVGNNLVTNLIAGVTRVNSLAFVGGSFIGYLPQMAIFALMGKGIVVMSWWKIALSGGLFFISGALSFRLYKQYKAAQLLADDASELPPGGEQ